MNTIRTTIGYVSTLLRPLGFGTARNASIAGIYNYVPIYEGIGTSGQPTELDFVLIAEAGYRTVVNLAPHNAENSLADERGTVTNLGLRYIHIPVNFKNPTNDDFDQFVKTMLESSGTKVWVHCAANMRVSAFIFRYRRDVLKEDEEIAAKDMAKIWEPFGVWSEFVRKSEKGAR
jgi:protein tyrosine phosphatase (PTP) superfamily phosphohydrolase (DUF442 family)